jgi:hypothetical protein
VGLTLLLAIMLVGTIIESKVERRPLVAIIAVILTWIVLGSWWEGLDLGRSLIPALFTVAAFGIIALLGIVWASRGSDQREFGHASHLALAGYVFLVFIAVRQALAFPPWPLFGVLAILTLAVGVTSLYLRRGTLTIGGAVAAQVVLLTWSGHTLTPHWANTGLAATLIVATWAYVWLFLAERVVGADQAFTFRIAAAVGLLLGHAVAIGVSISMSVPHLFATLLAIARAARHCHAGTGVADGDAFAGSLERGSHQPGHAGRASTTPQRAFTFAVVPYALYMLYPLLLGARAKRSLPPYLAAIVASATFFFFARSAMLDAHLGYMIGVLPVAQAIILLLLLVRLLRIEPPDARQLGRLAIVAGTALAFITAAIPSAAR